MAFSVALVSVVQGSEPAVRHTHPLPLWPGSRPPHAWGHHTALSQRPVSPWASRQPSNTRRCAGVTAVLQLILPCPSHSAPAPPFSGSAFCSKKNAVLYIFVVQKLFGEGKGGMFTENSIEPCILSRVKQITSPGGMHETSAQTWCTGKTQRDRVEREVGGGIGMGKTCISKADSCQCMTKPTTIL